MTVLEDGQSPPRRRSPPYNSTTSSSRSSSPFPPQPHRTSAQEPLLPYAYHPTSPTPHFDQYPQHHAQGGHGASNLNCFGAAWRQRGSRWKFLALLGGMSLLFLLHDHFFRRRRDGAHHGSNRPPWARPPFSKHPPPPLDDDAEFPTRPPPSTYTTAAATPSSTDTAEKEALPPIADPSLFAQPRRAIRPSWPDPWADLPSSWPGREYLSPSRFPDAHPEEGMTDPPERLPPPASHLSRAMEYAIEAARVLTKNKGKERTGSARQQPLPEFEARTGRPKQVPHEEVWIAQGGWKAPRVKVSEIRGGEMPRVQYEGVVEAGEEVESQRRAWVKRAFLHAWEGYKKHAWGHDEVMPLSNLFSNNYNGWGATIIDNLDTLLLLNLSHEYNLARAHLAAIDFTYLAPSGALTFSTKLPPLEHLDLPLNKEGPLEPPPGAGRFVNPRLAMAMNQHSPVTIPHFETTIRYLGGLLSAYDLSGDPLLLARATELGDWLLPALGTKHGLSINRYVLGSNPRGMNTGRATLSEVGSLTLEFTRLSMVTGDEIYYQAVQRSMDTLDRAFPDESPPAHGPNRGRLGTLLPSMVDPSRPDLMSGDYTFGGLADSYYEYLIKQAQLVSDELPQYSRMYEEAMDSAHEYLISDVEVVPGRKDLKTIGSASWGMYQATLDHLTCFAGGMLGLGSRLLKREKDLKTGQAVTEACAWAYESTKTGLGPESLTLYSPDDTSRYVTVETRTGQLVREPRGAPVLGVKKSNPRFIGRPETIESVFYQWRLTGDRKWQDRGWQMFTSWMEHSITESGFASLNNVYLTAPKKEDSQESFVLAETLKYYYLLFSPRDFISLDDWVFNTEAHPFLIPKASGKTSPHLWSGPDDASPPISDFASTLGEGTWVQKWARVQQAAGLLHPWKSTPLNANVPGGGARVHEERPPAARPPIRPSEEELERGKKAAAAAAGGVGAGKKVEEVDPLGMDVKAAVDESEKKKKEKQRMAMAMGGGRGMGGGGPPPPRGE